MTKLVRYRGGLPSVTRDEFSSLLDVDRIFDQMFGDTFSKQFGVGFFDKNAYPRVDVIDNETSVMVEAEVPGLTKEDISVDVEDSVLTIRGSKKIAKDSDESRTYIRREIKRSSFVRSFTLGEEYDLDGISADFDHGILKIEIPRRKESVEKNRKRKIL